MSYHDYTRPRLGVSLLACFLVSMTTLMASAQGLKPQVTKTPIIPFTTNTPKQVVVGTATLVSAYEPTSKLRLAISIRAPKMTEEEEFLKELQDKTSTNYHKFLTPDEWNARFAPAAEDEQAVVDWATSQGLTITARYPNRLMVNVEGTVGTIEKAFNIGINKYSVKGNVELSNDRDPQIPSNLLSIVEYVDGLNSIVRMRPANPRMKGVRGPDYAPGPMHQIGKTFSMSANTGAVKAQEAKGKRTAPVSSVGAQVTNGFYDPTDFWSQYGYDYNALQSQGHCCNPLGNPNQTPPETTIGVATDGDFADSDMVGFQAQYPYLAYHYGRVFVDGTPGGGDDETTLDLEWTTATSNSRGSFVDTSLVWVYEAAQGFGDFGTLFQQMVTDNKIRVVNISYGLSETVFLDDAPSLLTSWHAIFNQMIGQGWTIMAASGDGGSDAGCTGSLAVLYPESDPDVTSVGGTELFANGGFSSEVAWTGGSSAGSCSVNNGGGGGGCSAVWSAPSYQNAGGAYCGSGSRSVPDVSLNAGIGTNFFFSGSLSGVGGTSLASPLMSGFIAQENAYSLSMGNACGSGTRNCAPIGQVNVDIYAEGGYNHSAPHYPFYDITSGCTTNDTISSAWCATTGYDLATGWGSFNALQMAWAINWEDNLAYSAPSVDYSGPATNTWYNSDQAVSWSINGNGNVTGIAGFTQGWDSIPSDPFSDSNRNDSNSYFTGPQFPNATTGCLSLAGGFGCAGGVSQGCHVAHVRAWSNQGSTSGDATYGPVCYDTVAPVTSDSLSGTFSGGVYTTAVKVTLSASDASSGVSHTFYQLGSNPAVVYTAPFTISSTGGHTLHFWSTDVAGNTESAHTINVVIEAPTTTAVKSGANPSVYFQTVTYTATVKGTFGATPKGFVTFKQGGISMGPSAALNAAGVATITYQTFNAGSHIVTATYGGNGNNLASTSANLTQVVDKATTTEKVVSSKNPSTHGQSVTFTATTTPQFGGNTPNTVKFKDGSTIIATTTANPTTHIATFTTTTLSVGTHNIEAVYEGGSNLSGSTSPAIKQVVNQ
jgi:hypothetical protein